MALHLVAAADTGSGNFVVGLVLGLCIGLLVGPALRSWLVFREWTEASREAKLADRLVRRLESDAEGDVVPPSSFTDEPGTSDDRGTSDQTEAPTPAWPTPR